MSITLESTQQVLINRLREPMDLAEMNVFTTDVPNEDLLDPLTWALRAMDITLANPLLVTDSDLSGVNDNRVTELLDLAEYRLLKTIVSQMSQTDERLGPHGKWASQFPIRLTERLLIEEKRIQRVYGVNASTISVGALNIAELINDPTNL